MRGDVGSPIDFMPMRIFLSVIARVQNRSLLVLLKSPELDL